LGRILVTKDPTTPDQVASCKIEKDPETCKSKGFGFVTFVDPADAAAAVGFIEMGGRDVEVRMASRAERYLDGAGRSTRDV
jgi:RNA recognition motif-containing protein